MFPQHEIDKLRELHRKASNCGPILTGEFLDEKVDEDDQAFYTKIHEVLEDLLKDLEDGNYWRERLHKEHEALERQNNEQFQAIRILKEQRDNLWYNLTNEIKKLEDELIEKEVQIEALRKDLKITKGD